MPWITKLHYKLPMVSGFLAYITSQVIQIAAPDRGYLFLIISAFLEACSFAVIGPLVGEMTVLTIDPKERARIQSILYVAVILFTAPFGWIAGTLSSHYKDLPFILNIVLFTIGAALAYVAGEASQRRLASEAEAV
jgi:MFS family permease